MDSKELFDKIRNPILRLLSAGQKNLVAIDIGLSAVKVAEMSGSVTADSFKLQKFATVPLPEGCIIEDEIQKEEEIMEAIEEALDKANITSKVVCLGLYGPNSVIKKLQLAGGSEEEVEDQVLWEVEQYLPFSLEESTVSFYNVGMNEGGGVDVLVAAIKNDISKGFCDLFVKLNMTVKIVDLGAIALINLFTHCFKDKIKSSTASWVVIDLGAQKTNFMIYKNNMVAFAKEINVGGVMITEEIQRQMGVNYIEAEDLKIKGDGKGNLPEEILEIIDEVVEAFFAEIKKIVDFYISATSDESLVGCIVTGGCVLIPGMKEGLEALLGVEVTLLDPLQTIDYDEADFSDDELREIKYMGATVLGLGMRGLC